VEYLRDEQGDYRPYGVVVLTVGPAGISRVSSFGDPRLVGLFGFPGHGARVGQPRPDASP
jgi:RNA polymerase sigma-70 factor (ECF subfamily)